MTEVKQYVLSLAASAMLCGALLSISPEGTVRQLLRLLSGLLLTICVLRPVVGVELPLEFPAPELSEAEAVTAQGEKAAYEAIAGIIKRESEAYILDKAAELGAQVEVEIRLEKGELPVPCAAVIRGQVSPYARGRLEEYLSSELGITKEYQQWIG